MNNLIKSNKPAILLTSLITGYLIFSGCSKSRNGGKVTKIKKWVNWQIEFKKNVRDLDKARVLLAVQKYIFGYLSKLVDSKIVISYVKFNKVSFRGQNRVSFTVTFSYERIAKDASPTPSVGPHPPKDEDLPQELLHFIKYIINIIPEAGEFQTGNLQYK